MMCVLAFCGATPRDVDPLNDDEQGDGFNLEANLE
jgi:hypothetical protein